MPEYVLLRLEGPLQSWGDVAVDQRRPTAAFPTKSALTGLLASALGWSYRDGARINSLQDAVEYAVREDRQPQLLRDFQTAFLGREAGGWTHWGYEARGGGAARKGTHLLEKSYLADGSFLVALSIASGPVTLDELEQALERPAHTLFLGRKACLPSRRFYEGRAIGATAREVLEDTPVRDEYDQPPLRCWAEPTEDDPGVLALEVWDRRDFESDLFAGSRWVVETTVEPTVESCQA